jgi:hypothetical protein
MGSVNLDKNRLTGEVHRAFVNGVAVVFRTCAPIVNGFHSVRCSRIVLHCQNREQIERCVESCLTVKVTC